MKILIVDDLGVNRKLLRVTLEAEGLETMEASDGIEAIALLERETVDAIVSDVLMPRMDGFRFCHAVRMDERLRSIPFIIYTGTYTSPGDEHLSMRAGADAYVRKPCATDVLVATIRDAVAAPRRQAIDGQAPPPKLEMTAEYSAAIIKKLEEKNADLERTQDELRDSIVEREAVEEALRRTLEDLQAAKVLADRAKAAAEEASRAKDHFLAVLSHELRTPLTPALTAVSLLEADPNLSRAARNYVDVIRRNVRLESRLIDDLLDLTAIARGKVLLDRREVDLRTIIDRAVEVCRPDIEARSLHFGVDYGPGLHVVFADAARLQQVLWNLLKNAIKFTPRDGCVGVRCRDESGVVVLEVNDSGIGMEPASLPVIFDAFAQAERSITKQFGGLGLGLAISKALVELHGGTIEAESRGVGHGASFKVRLPSHSVPARAQTVAAASRPAGAAPQHRMRVLLVEDHGDTSDMIVMLLEAEGHRVATAGDVEGALRTAAGASFDLLISDLGLPDGSGLDLLRELRARGNRVPAIALSGYGQDRDVEQSRDAGFQLHLIKPVEPHRLLEAMQNVRREHSNAR